MRAAHDCRREKEHLARRAAGEARVQCIQGAQLFADAVVGNLRGALAREQMTIVVQS